MPSVVTGPRALLITLDAFGTLYRPRGGMAGQYLDVARSCGLRVEADTGTLGRHFNDAFRAQHSRSPNYGKTGAMRPETWWAKVVDDTFRPLLSPGQAVPPRLADSLFERFSNREGYELFPDVLPFFRRLDRWKQMLGAELGLRSVAVGVLTNSDPRVAHVLADLDVVVGDPGRGRGGGQVGSDLDFILTSYEIGKEKPDPATFFEAEQVARRMLGLENLRPDAPDDDDDDDDDDDVAAEVIKVHIGDDLHRDYWAAIRCGRRWHALLLHRDADEGESPYHGVQHITKLTGAQAVLMPLLQRAVD